MLRTFSNLAGYSCAQLTLLAIPRFGYGRAARADRAFKREIELAKFKAYP